VLGTAHFCSQPAIYDPSWRERKTGTPSRTRPDWSTTARWVNLTGSEETPTLYYMIEQESCGVHGDPAAETERWLEEISEVGPKRAR
jgi:hypothetical protein